MKANHPKKQSGAMLLEALIAILIFSFGILAVIGLQAASVRASTDAKYRSEASFLVNQIIGQMWASDRTFATLKSNFEGGGTVTTPGALYLAWKNDVNGTLPGNVTPVVSVTAGTPIGSVANITVFWQLPSDTVQHSYSTIVPII